MTEQVTTSSTLAGIAAILSAVAWPIVASVCIFFQRKRIAELITVLTAKITSAKHIKAAGIELAEDLIDNAVQQSPIASEKSVVPQQQINFAKDLQEKVELAGVDSGEAARSAAERIRSLSTSYEEIRQSMLPSHARTVKMDHVVARMRTLALLARPLLPRLSRSNLAGERLAAIATLQVEPSNQYSRWLAERMSVETPFIFFHAALALRELVVSGKGLDQDDLRDEIQSALKKIQGYPDGPPDENTIEVLQDALHRMESSF